MSRRKSRLYPEEFKQSSVKLAIESGQSIAKTSRNLGVNENTLRTWVRFYSKSNEVVDIVFPIFIYSSLFFGFVKFT